VTANARGAGPLDVDLPDALVRLLEGSPSATPEALLDRVLAHVRGRVGADGGALYLREGGQLRLVVAQNDTLERKLGVAAFRARLVGLCLPVQPTHVAGYVALTGVGVNLPDVERIPPGRPYTFTPALSRDVYRHRSLLTVPLAQPGRPPCGVLQLVNARGESGTFDGDAEAYATRVGVWLARWLEAPERALDPPRAPRPSAPDARGVCEVPRPHHHERRGATGGASGALGALARPVRPSRRTGELLVDKGLITPEQLARVLAEQQHSHEKVGTILVRLGFLTERQLVEVLSEQYGLPTVDLATLSPSHEALRTVPADLARKYSLLPLARVGRVLRVAMADPTDVAAVDALRFVTGLHVELALAPLREIRDALERAYAPAVSPPEPLDEATLAGGDIELVERGDERAILDLSTPGAAVDDTPVVRLVNRILVEGLARGASDIHVEALAQAFRVRLRVDGRLVPLLTLPKRLQAPTVARLKVMADLDIAQHRLPQDGRIKLRYNGRTIDVRVSIIPTLFGESVSLRILDGAVLQPDLSRLGFDPWGLAEFTRALQNPHGVILITGPTGSGKTTTLYSAIHALSQRDLKILTVEDPVEYALDGINQVHVQEEIGRTFAATLRAFLRHDPDVILVGEMRDLETAQTAIRAGLTGHLVLSTLHTNDGASTLMRLLDMTIPPFLVAAALRLVVAQRLVRKLCPECREPYELDEAALEVHGHMPRGAGRVVLYRAVGCPACDFVGLKGRVGVFEVMPVTPAIADLILRHGAAAEIREAARQAGMKTLREGALLKALEGLTTLEEVLRVTSE
jgi:type IV pilus assembly protein PilB